MAFDGAWNAYIFREGRNQVCGADLVNQLAQKLIAIGSAGPGDNRVVLLDALLRAGELESALLDAGSPQADLIMGITDRLAGRLVAANAIDSEDLVRCVRALLVPETVAVAPPEGFAYYSLHPLDYSDLAKSIPLSGKNAAVIGIRSIGTTLSAVVQATLRQSRISVERITVRPTGHPYDRRTELTSDQLHWVARMQSAGAEFFVVDEGPGMSGSSFLSVGDALVAAGISHSRIAFLCSRNPDPASLAAPQAVTRWPTFRRYCTQPTCRLPEQAKVYIAGGIWRAHVYADQEQWPASWLQMERLKFLSKTGDKIFKFEGYGRFGQIAHNRAIRIAQAGFGPVLIGFEEGFGIYPRLRGKVLSSSDASPAVLQRIADYCTFRAHAMPAELPVNHHLEIMLRFNVKEEFAADLPEESIELRVVTPVIADGRMSPHKWIDSNGTLLKVDGNIHGDDHFFPGPTDIAWDLAGAIVEWELTPESSRVLLENYHRASGDDARARISNYLAAYSIFRTAFSKMASASMQGGEEEARLVRDYHRYRTQARQFLGLASPAPVVPKLTLESPESELSAA